MPLFAAAKLKKQYPRLPICILGDGLYPYEKAFHICEEYGWKYLFVLQDKSLKTVQEELTLTRRSKPVDISKTVDAGWMITQAYNYQTGIEYHGKYILNWVQCIEQRKKMKDKKTPETLPPDQASRFEYVTNLPVDKENVKKIATTGRLRWKIENEGFNTQKCGDYELEHKFCRNSYNGLKNYYTLLQIAHAINQLVEKEKCVTEILKLRPKETVRNLWSKLKGLMIFCHPDTIWNYIKNHILLKPAPS